MDGVGVIMLFQAQNEASMEAAVMRKAVFEAEGASIYGVLTTLFKPDEGRNPGIRFRIWMQVR